MSGGDVTGKRSLHCTLFGQGITASLSPFLHGWAAHRQGLELVYDLQDCSRQEFPALLGEILDRGYCGANVTHPHKLACYDLVTRRSDSALNCGSMNVLVAADKGWQGLNTDGPGFLAPLLARDFKPQSVLIAGSGGVARSIVYSLHRQWPDCRIHLRVRQPARAAKMLDQLKVAAILHPWPDPLPQVQLLINATPLGMPTTVDAQLPFPEEMLAGQPLCYDLVSAPHTTAWLKIARGAGCSIVHGLEMLVAQAKPAFELWTGRKFPQAEMLELATARLAVQESLKNGQLAGPVVLLGFMGCGKSQTALELARLLDFRHIDLDAVIEKQCGTSITQLFESEGEAAFRSLEREHFARLLNPTHSRGLIIGAGGGLALKSDFFAIFKSKACFIFMDTAFEEIERRLDGDRNRPLLKKLKGPLELKALYDARRSTYVQAGIHCSPTIGAAAPQVAEQVLLALTSHLQEKQR